MRKITYSDAINDALREGMRRDPKVIVTGEDVAGGAKLREFERADAWGGVFGVTRDLVSEFGRQRVIDTPISETAYLGVAIGAATHGFVTVTEIQFLDFVGVLSRPGREPGGQAPLCPRQFGVGRSHRRSRDGGRGVRAGGTQSQSFHSSIAHCFPGIKVVAPSNPARQGPDDRGDPRPGPGLLHGAQGGTRLRARFPRASTSCRSGGGGRP